MREVITEEDVAMFLGGRVLGNIYLYREVMQVEVSPKLCSV